MDITKHSRPGATTIATHHLYTLYGEIAWGGMATVRLARQTGPHGLSRIVAVKNLLARSAPDSEFVAMFRDEIRVASRVNHPNVVPVLDVVATEDELLLVMEYVHGESVARLLKRCRGAIPPPIASTIMSGVLRGLHAAHLARSVGGEALHIVHRDVTPHNMVVGVDGTPRLLDFGIAHAEGRLHATRFGHVKGKLAYMAPEQFLNTAVDRRVDIYSAAVTLWEMLTGRRLFDGHKDKMLQMILHQTTPPPGSLQRGISSRLDAIVLRGLHRDPGQRFATAREMASALEQETEIVSATELGDWVGRTWGDARERREHQIRSIEDNTLAAVEQDRPPLLAPPSDTGAPPWSSHSESVTRALDREPREPATPQPELPTRPDLPSALFIVPHSTPVIARTPRPEPGQRTSTLKRGGLLVLPAAACLLLVAHLWLGVGARHDMEPSPLTIPAGPPIIPNIEPLRTKLVLPAESPSTPAPVGPSAAPAPSTYASSAQAQDQALDQTKDQALAVSPATQTPAAEHSSSPSRARPEETNPRQRSPVRRGARRATAIAAVSPSSRAPAAAVQSGPSVLTPAASGASQRDTDCDPPFVVDSKGIKHFKLACL